MSQKGSIIFRVIAAVILVAVMVGGVFMAYQAGQAQGYALGVSTTDGSQAGVVAPQTHPVPFSPGMMGHHYFFPFMGFFGFIPLLIGICLFFGLIRMIMWGPRHRHYGPWMYGPQGNYPWHGEPCDHPWHGEHPTEEPGAGKPQGQEDKK
jgi:hypothetical protein